MSKRELVSTYSLEFELLLQKHNMEYIMEHKISGKEIREICTDYYKENNLKRDILCPNRIFDFYLPEYNLYIELNTLFTHCLDKHYKIHKLKRKFAELTNSNILFIWDTYFENEMPKLTKSDVILYSQYMRNDFINQLEEVIISIKQNKLQDLRNKFHSKENKYYSIQYLIYMRKMKEIKKQMGELERDGRPKGSYVYKEKIIEYFMQYGEPNNKTKMSLDLDISRQTLYRHYDSALFEAKRRKEEAEYHEILDNL